MKKNLKSGQALIVLLVLMAVMIMVTSVSVVLMLVNSQNASVAQIGDEAIGAAESGVENALILMLRDPYGYTGEELNLPNGATVKTNISSGDFPKIITATGSAGYIKRTLEVGVLYNDNKLSISRWRENY